MSNVFLFVFVTTTHGLMHSLCTCSFRFLFSFDAFHGIEGHYPTNVVIVMFQYNVLSHLNTATVTYILHLINGVNSMFIFCPYSRIQKGKIIRWTLPL